ncbi:MAG TPA: hypothetical protein DIW30_02610 [Bacteroidales bacterium]|nr:hypothetical protein [Bacteroidales bacterium]
MAATLAKQTNKLKNGLPYLAVLVAMLFWGASGIATKTALRTLQPLSLVTCRFLLAVTIMWLVGKLTKQLQRPDRKDLPLFLLAGLAQPVCYYIFETYGIKLLSSPTIAEVLLSTSPLFAPLFAYLLIHERVTLCNILGIALSAVGVLLMVLVGSSDFSIGSPWGILLAFLAVFSAVIYTVLLRKMPVKYNSLSIVFYVQLSSLLFFVPMFCLIDLPRVAFSDFTLPALGAISYLAVCSSVIAFILFCYTVRRIGVTCANAFNNIRPVFTALFMFLFFGEHLPWVNILGMGLVIAGLFVCQYEKNNHKQYT